MQRPFCVSVPATAFLLSCSVLPIHARTVVSTLVSLFIFLRKFPKGPLREMLKSPENKLTLTSVRTPSAARNRKVSSPWTKPQRYFTRKYSGLCRHVGVFQVGGSLSAAYQGKPCPSFQSTKPNILTVLFVPQARKMAVTAPGITTSAKGRKCRRQGKPFSGITLSFDQ